MGTEQGASQIVAEIESYARVLNIPASELPQQDVIPKSDSNYLPRILARMKASVEGGKYIWDARQAKPAIVHIEKVLSHTGGVHHLTEFVGRNCDAVPDCVSVDLVGGADKKDGWMRFGLTKAILPAQGIILSTAHRGLGSDIRVDCSKDNLFFSVYYYQRLFGRADAHGIVFPFFPEELIIDLTHRKVSLFDEYRNIARDVSLDKQFSVGPKGASSLVVVSLTNNNDPNKLIAKVGVDTGRANTTNFITVERIVPYIAGFTSDWEIVNDGPFTIVNDKSIVEKLDYFLRRIREYIPDLRSRPSL